MSAVKKILFLFIAITSLVGCQSTSSHRITQNDINNMKKVNNYDGLIRYYKSELTKGNNVESIKEELAWAYFGKGDLESANFYVQNLTEEGFNNAKLYQLQGAIFDKKDDQKNAIKAFLKSIDADNRNGEVYLLLGISYIKKGDYELAYRELNNARLLGYDDVAIKNNIAMIYMAKGEYEKIIETLSPVLRENPTNKTIKANLAVALFKTDKVNAAKQILNGEFSESELESIALELTY